MSTVMQLKMRALQKAIIDNGYYVDIYKSTLRKNDMAIEGIDNDRYDDKKIVFLCHYFWEALPNSPEIRVYPFMQLCDIAENVFDY